jgi:hypothetical protein
LTCSAAINLRPAPSAPELEGPREDGMDPNSGKFYPMNDADKNKKGSKTYEAIKKNWPIFEIGETIMIKGYPFRLEHIKYSSGRMILKPVK